jgi:hypothetical protein
MKYCFDEAVLQAYVDGELSDDRASEIARHLAACSECDDLVGGIQADLAVLSSALEAEFGVAVPTSALRSRLDAAIKQTESPVASAQRAPAVSFWERLSAAVFATFSSALVPAGAVAAILLVAGLISVYVVKRLSAPLGEMAVVNKSELVPVPVASELEGLGIDSPTPSNPPTVQPQPVRKARKAPISGNAVQHRPNRIEQPLPGEAGYLNAIASLSGAVKQGSTTLKPTVVAEYERNLAIVDNAINETRQTARQNPQDKDAAAFLYASYQSKVDLLNAVADQSLIARR